MKPLAQARRPARFFILRYVPNPVAGEFTNFGLILIVESGFAGVRFGDLSRVTRFDPLADIEVLQALEDDIRNKLSKASDRDVMLQTFVDSLSNTIQIS